MTRSKKLIALGAVFLLLCAATFLIMHTEKKQENIRNTDEIVLEIPYEDMVNVKWKNFGSDEELSFTKGEEWKYDGDESFPVDEELMEKLLEPFTALGADFIIESPEDMKQYGFDEPACEIEISTADESFMIKLGDFSQMDNQRYISTGDGNVYLIDDDPFPRFNRDYTDFIKNDEIPEIDKVDSISFQSDDFFKITRNEEEDRNTLREDDIFFTEADGEEVPLSTQTVTDYVNVLKYLRFENFADYNADEADLEKYGLDDPELIFSIEFISRDDEGNEVPGTVKISISRDPEELEAVKDDSLTEDSSAENTEEEETITAYIRLNDSPIIYNMISSDYTKLMKHDFNDFRHREIIPCDFDDISEIEATLDGVTYKITSEIKDDVRNYFYDGEQIDITDIRDSVNFLKADEFINTSSDEKKELSLKFTMDFENDPATYVDIYRYDGENCLITIDGNSFALTERRKAVELIEDINSLVLKKAE